MTVKLGELIEELNDYRNHTIGVDEDTEVTVHDADGTPLGTVSDVKVILTRRSKSYGGKYTDASVVLEIE